MYKPALLDQITTKDIELAYNFRAQGATASIAKILGLVSKLVEISDDSYSETGPHVCYRIDILLAGGESILNFSLVRYLYPAKELWGQFCTENVRIQGKVAYNANLAVRTEFQGKGIGKLIYELEEALYRKWGAHEIQLMAAYVGRHAWRKSGFVIHCDEISLVEYFYEEWCAERNVNYTALRDTLKYPKEFLLSPKVKKFRMYKELN